MHFGRLSCLFNSHKPNRRSVKWTGLSYEGNCRSCGRLIARAHAGKWRRIAKSDLETVDSTG
ncbi:hypothetical protein AQZ49_12625 [Novosphingobium sp. FSW06-99]|nr:hypothetical protein AQZ49_12625 [Novosphingobium sp. FSW06-99]